MSRTPTPAELADKFEFVTSRAIRLKAGNAFVTSEANDDAIAEGAGETLAADTVQIGMSNGATLTNLAAGDTDISGIAIADLTDFTEVRVSTFVKTVGVTGRIRVDYTTDFSTFAPLVANSLPLDGAGLVRTDWEAIPAGARTVASYKGVAFGGDTSEDPEFIGLVIEVRR